jgi:hypothetical protein
MNLLKGGIMNVDEVTSKVIGDEFATLKEHCILVLESQNGVDVRDIVSGYSYIQVLGLANSILTYLLERKPEAASVIEEANEELKQMYDDQTQI